MIESLKTIASAFGLVVLIEVGFLASIVLYCVIREFIRRKRK